MPGVTALGSQHLCRPGEGVIELAKTGLFLLAIRFNGCISDRLTDDLRLLFELLLPFLTLRRGLLQQGQPSDGCWLCFHWL